VIALAWIVAFAAFVVVGGVVGALVLALGGVAMCVASWLSRREPHGRFTEGTHPYPYWMWNWGLLAMGLLSIVVAVVAVVAEIS
jgi:hypothetical membrane protein